MSARPPHKFQDVKGIQLCLLVYSRYHEAFYSLLRHSRHSPACCFQRVIDATFFILLVIYQYRTYPWFCSHHLRLTCEWSHISNVSKIRGQRRALTMSPPQKIKNHRISTFSMICSKLPQSTRLFSPTILKNSCCVAKTNSPIPGIELTCSILEAF